ncbi:hypothetical protein NW755_014883, partial [Fusarium falciforme]
MMLDDKLYKAPIGDNPQRILDIGTGTGIWAMSIDDAQLDWTFEPESFDFIHVRYMVGAFDVYPKPYRQMFKALKLGGWFQHLEPNIHLRACEPRANESMRTFTQWADLFYDAGDEIGRTFR